ncbi:MAG: hypothetical protein HONBIEJF_00668 [Fimbriimonadaceae bacterium]|nr:hypothetical protein [Fimbriimonadaceae bacterium]
MQPATDRQAARNTPRTEQIANGQSRRRLAEPVHDRRHDVAGILLLALAGILLIALALGNAGAVGQFLHDSIRLFFGRGAWLTPIVLGFIGISLIAGRSRWEWGRMSWGLSILFVTVVGAMAGSVRGDFFDPSIVAGSGGYVGAVIGWLLDMLLGVAKPVGFGALGMVGLILCLDAPIRSVLSTLAARARQVKPPVAKLGQQRERPIPTPMAAVRMPEPEAIAGEPIRKKPEPRISDTISTSATTLEAIPKEGYTLPPLNLLVDPPARPKRSPEEMRQNIEILEGTLEQFNIDANVVEIATGPTITRYEIQLGPGIRVARITALADNIAMNLAASHVRVEAPIPGKAAIGVEVPNVHRSVVSLRELFDADEVRTNPSRLVVALGQDVSGNNRYADLAKMPHLLIGGATNSGKSIGLATIITSLLLRNTPKDVKLVLIDPKRVELSLFDHVPHLMCPVVRDIKEAPGVLRAVWREMDRRYDIFAEAGVRNIDGWNERASFQERMPYIVVVIDELADLMIQAAAEVETSICRLAQLARATGIHLVIATQRPSVDVITGTIKANIASRIAFSVSSQIDSRTILDQKGAEDLVGRGDMLFLPIDESKPVRIQGCYVGEKEIESICGHWRAQEKPQYVLNPIQVALEDREAELAEQENDPLWEECVRFVVDRTQASTSMLQRRFSIGFQRASRLLDLMEERGIVGPRDGPRPRQVLIDAMEVDQLFGRQTFLQLEREEWQEDE